jgi:MFS family permease
MAHVDARIVALRQARFAELALAIGAFAIGTGEFAAMGFLPSVADGLGVTIPEAGRSISAYALGVVVGAPLIAVLGAKLSRRALLLVLMSLFAAGNLASALAPNFVSLLGLRFASGLPHGAYFGVAALVAAGMAGPAGRARAVGRVMLGLTVATLVGTPVATWAGQALGWRTGFAFVGTLALVTFALLTLCVPCDTPSRGAGPLRELGALKEPQVWLTLAIAAVGFGGMFAVFSYITPTLIHVAGIPEQAVPFVICVFGAGGRLSGTRRSSPSSRWRSTTPGRRSRRSFWWAPCSPQGLRCRPGLWTSARRRRFWRPRSTIPPSTSPMRWAPGSAGSRSRRATAGPRPASSAPLWRLAESPSSPCPWRWSGRSAGLRQSALSRGRRRLPSGRLTPGIRRSGHDRE